MSRLAGDEGSGSVLMVSVMAATMLLAGIALPFNAALTARQQVSNAADAAALAAADTASGYVAGSPCPNAAEGARLNGAALTTCTIGGSGRAEGLEATVVVERIVIGIAVRATAKAGPPP
ncbi:hypothetical protein GCM10027416_07630 [Okibacterium endophyticum]